MASWQPPKDFSSRPVTVLGGGVLGRRIGLRAPLRHESEILT